MQAFLLRRILGFYDLRKVPPRLVHKFLSAAGFIKVCDKTLLLAKSEAMDELHGYKGVQVRRHLLHCFNRTNISPQGVDNLNVCMAFKTAVDSNRALAVSVLADCNRDKKKVAETIEVSLIIQSMYQVILLL